MKDAWKIAFSVICSLLAAGLILLASGRPRGQPVSLLPPPTPAPLVVHVLGAVAQPGLYQLPAGSRVQDAIQAAGDLLPEADLSTVNLAALLQDGQRILVPTPPPPTSTPDPNAPRGSKAATPVVIYPLNINTASQAELESLPEIGPATAQKIIEYRQTHGPFTSIEQIMEVENIGPKTFEQIKDLITV
ncbi:MAG: ComEA family DNA-binding protein [Chloroflexota bacterium]